jgi:hypothetical protein
MKLLGNICRFNNLTINVDQIFCVRQILEKEFDYNKTVNQLFMDFKKAYDSVRTEVLYNILITFLYP